MNYKPEYIRPIDMDPNLSPLEKANQILAFADQYPEDKDYIYAWGILALRGINDDPIVIEYGTKYLPLTEKVECRENIQMMLRHAYLDTDQPEKAIEVLLQQLDETDARYVVLENIIEVYEKMNDPVNAVKYYEQYVSECTADAEIYSKLAKQYDAIGNHTKAAHYYEQAAIETSYESADWWFNTGRSLALAGKEEEAMYYFQLALKINPKHAMALYCIGQVYHNKDDVYRAMHHYTEALKINPGLDIVYNNMAAIELHEHGSIALAIENIEKALSVNDGDTKMLALLYGNLSKLYGMTADYEKREIYKGKMFEALGFPVEFIEIDEEDFDVRDWIEDDEDYDEEEDYDDEEE